MAHVLYHNLEDIVSMAPLAHQVCGTFGGVLDPHPQDLLAIAQAHSSQGHWSKAETAYRRGLAASLPVLQHGEALAGLAAVLKHEDRLDEVAVCWAQLAALELARQVKAILSWPSITSGRRATYNQPFSGRTAALDLVLAWPPGYQRTRAP